MGKVLDSVWNQFETFKKEVKLMQPSEKLNCSLIKLFLFLFLKFVASLASWYMKHKKR